MSFLSAAAPLRFLSCPLIRLPFKHHPQAGGQSKRFAPFPSWQTHERTGGKVSSLCARRCGARVRWLPLSVVALSRSSGRFLACPARAFFCSPRPSPLPTAFSAGGPGVVPPGGNLHWPPRLAVSCGRRRRTRRTTEHQKKDHENQRASCLDWERERRLPQRGLLGKGVERRPGPRLCRG